MCNTSSPLEKVLSKWSLFVHLLPLPHCSHKNVPWLVAITLASELLPSGFCLFVCFRKCNWSIWQAASQCSLIKHNVESMVWWAYFLIFFKKLSFFFQSILYVISFVCVYLPVCIFSLNHQYRRVFWCGNDYSNLSCLEMGAFFPSTVRLAARPFESFRKLIHLSEFCCRN